ncbi:MAG: type II toxin-antitoxin system RelE/ParE family toxin [Clostridia bacterium]|jgi:mRNA interferase RelE/StbE|nr:type II toxin-antitoxin system RelE/ParE family toxin [Clostridia bacterium]MDH7572238.1 type II toxin-antitoxin system RelE/ParE family toxin [Clostridia bacterium]
MEYYSVYLKPSAEKDLRRLSPPLVSRVLAAIEGLRSAPFPPGAVKLTGAQRVYRLRVGDYRIIYEVNAHTREVTVYYVRHRREAYRSLP